MPLTVHIPPPVNMAAVSHGGDDGTSRKMHHMAMKMVLNMISEAVTKKTLGRVSTMRKRIMHMTRSRRLAARLTVAKTMLLIL